MPRKGNILKESHDFVLSSLLSSPPVRLHMQAVSATQREERPGRGIRTVRGSCSQRRRQQKHGPLPFYSLYGDCRISWSCTAWLAAQWCVVKRTRLRDSVLPVCHRYPYFHIRCTVHGNQVFITVAHRHVRFLEVIASAIVKFTLNKKVKKNLFYFSRNIPFF